MNRWKTKKKAKEAEAAVRGASTDSDPPAIPTIKPSKTFRLGRKAQEPEAKPKLNLENALPSSDDFRTSLLMSGLSARFSMLREQDDPKSKIGKASDDSVLFPKRQSRLHDFGFQSHGLSDIAEVSSINGSVRPPFAFSRTDSYHDGYGTDDDSTYGGSIMNRKKPGEGNNLFGGRQKIYKIPVSTSTSAKSPVDGSSGGGMGGRALYENDVSQSAFQKLREREKEQQREEREGENHSRPSSPPLTGYNRNRETSSTTSSGGPSNTRSSTAATSITSQRTPSLSGQHTPVSPGLDRTMTKGRRLYETGLDQHLHEQQHSAMSRIDTLTRQRNRGAQTPPPGGISPAGLNQPNDRWDRQPMAGKQSMPNLRGAGPPPAVTPLNTFDFGVKSSNPPDTKPFGFASPPLSPPVSECEDHTILPVQPNDRGKATALGAFSKPAQPYDENKYSQRQLQMQQGRETPPLRKQSPPRAFISRQQQQQQMGRNRADSAATFASGRSSSNSSVQRHFLPHERIPESSPAKLQPTVPEKPHVSSGTFLASPSSNSSNDVEAEQNTTRGAPHLDLSKMYSPNQQISLERPPESQHPANRHRPFPQSVLQTQQPSQSPGLGGSNGRSPALPTPSSQATASNLTKPPIGLPADSPTLGPATGLSGMVRQHLRTDSNTSSVYGGAPSAGLVSRFPDQSEPLPAQNEYSTRNNPWDTEDWDRGYDEEYNVNPPENSTPKKTDSAMPPPLSVRSPNVGSPEQENRKPSWEREMDSYHTRTGSTETQKERQDFQNELASRRRRVQESLKSFVETESRAASPMLGSDSPRDGTPMKNPALGLLKNKSSRGSLVGKPKEAGQSKAMKMLGIGSPNTMMGGSGHAKQTFADDSWKQEEEEMLRGVPKPLGIPPQTKAFRQARRDAQRDRERQLAQRHQQQKAAAESSDSQWSASPVESQPRQLDPSIDRFSPNIRTGLRDPSRERKPPPVTLSHRNGSSQESGSGAPSRSSRDRSSSDASGRSKSRNGRYRDDLAKAMAEGTSTSSQGVYEELEAPANRFMPKSPGTPNMGFQQSPMPSPMVGTNFNGRSRSNSKSTPAGYFDPQKLQTLQTASDLDQTPRPSPGAPGFSANPTLPLAQQSPAVSAASTPTTQGFQSQGRVPAGRKRSINKSEISEPKLISSTSRITTVNLPPGSSLQNGIEPHSAPPIPPVNPRRRQTRAIFGAFIGRKDDHDDLHSLPAATQSTEEMSTFSADEGDAKPKSRQKLRKSSSEGGTLNARARQAAFAAPSPALPTGTFPPGAGSPPRPIDGGMF